MCLKLGYETEIKFHSVRKFLLLFPQLHRADIKKKAIKSDKKKRAGSERRKINKKETDTG